MILASNAIKRRILASVLGPSGSTPVTVGRVSTARICSQRRCVDGLVTVGALARFESRNRMYDPMSPPRRGMLNPC